MCVRAIEATDDGKIRRMRFAFRITRERTPNTNTLIILYTYCFSTEKLLTRTYLNISFCVCCLFLCMFSSWICRDCNAHLLQCCPFISYKHITSRLIICFTKKENDIKSLFRNN